MKTNLSSVKTRHFSLVQRVSLEIKLHSVSLGKEVYFVKLSFFSFFLKKLSNHKMSKLKQTSTNRTRLTIVNFNHFWFWFNIVSFISFHIVNCDSYGEANNNLWYLTAFKLSLMRSQCLPKFLQRYVLFFSFSQSSNT